LEYYELTSGIRGYSALVDEKVNAIERRYRNQIGDTFTGSLNSRDIEAYHLAVKAGNFYEVVSTYDNIQRAAFEKCSIEVSLPTFGLIDGSVPVLRGNNKATCFLEAMTDGLEEFEYLMDNQDPYYVSGVRDPGVFSRDIRANHLGAQFGVDAFYFPQALPPQP
jgi:hypothetical protein